MNLPPALRRPGTAALVLATMLGAASCTSTAPKQEQAGPPAHECYWKGDGVSGKPRIHISLSEQCVRYFKGDQLVGVSPISSGREGYSTRRGSFSVMEKDLHHRSTLYGAFVDAGGNIVQEDVDIRKDSPPPGTRFVGAEMPGFMRITGAIGMHAGYLPGYPASHGCIRLPAHMAEVFYQATPTGTPVKIEGDASEAPTRPPVVVAVAQPEEKARRKSRRRDQQDASGTAHGQTRYMEDVRVTNQQPATHAENRTKEKTKEQPVSTAVAEKIKPKPKAHASVETIFGSGKKKTPPVLRGQTLYLEE